MTNGNSAPQSPEDAYSDPRRFILKLYVAGMSPRSRRAIENVQKVCAERLAEHYELQVIDLYQAPQLAAGDQIIAVPTLIKQLPAPLRRIIGDMSDTENLLVGLDVKEWTSTEQ